LAGKLAWVERLAPDGRAARTGFRHDDRRRLLAIESPEGLVARVDRDSLGRPVAWHGAVVSLRAARFDAFGRLASWRERDAITMIEWGADGLPAGIQWPAGDRWRFDWGSGAVAIASDRGWRARGEAG